MIQSLSADELAARLAELEEQAERGQPSKDATLVSLQAELNTVITQLRQSPDPATFEQETACQKATQMVQALGQQQDEPERTIDTIGSTLRGRSFATEYEPLAQLGVYELLAKLGEGGMGAVYKARHVKLDKVVAIKVLPAERMKDKLAVSRFEREMRAVGKLEHPHIVRAMDAGEADGVHYLAMEYVQGVDLSQLVKECHPLPIADACELIRQAALGLDEAHENGMVHRDIKPSNLMLCSIGKKKPPIVKILDMGLALLSEAHTPEAQGLTTTGQMMGTLDYMSPEQGGDSKGVDIRADIYALGATLYKLLCGESIYHGEKYQTPVQKMMALATQPAPAIQSRRTGVPNALAAVLHRMLAKNPSERYATPAEVANALAPFCSGANLAALVQRAGLDSPAAKDAPTLPSLSHPETNTSVGSEQKTTPQDPVTDFKKRKASPRPLLLMGAISAAVLVIAAAIVFFVQTPQGTLRVELNDPNLEVSVKGSNVVFKKDGQEAYEIAAGDKKLVVKHGEFTFETKQFELKKNSETVIKVELLPGELRVVSSDGISLGSHKLAPPASALASNPSQGKTPEKVVPSGKGPGLASVGEKPVILVRKGKPVRQYKYITNAMMELQAGDVIEICDSQPQSIEFEEGFSKPLHIRGGGGHRPQLELVGKTKKPMPALVTFEHCELTIRYSGKIPFTTLHLANCRLSGYALSFEGTKGAFTATNSLIVLLQGMHIHCLESFDAQLTNCLVRTVGPTFSLRPNITNRLQFRRNTFYSDSNYKGGLLLGAEGAQASVIAESNIFRFQSQADLFQIPNWRTAVDWQGRENLYSGILFRIVDDQNNVVRFANLDDWNAGWKQPEIGSQYAEEILPLFRQTTLMPLAELHALVEPIVTGARERYDLPQLGCDWSLVGAGDAYVRALKLSGQSPAELGREASTGGPIAILRDGKEVSSYRDLESALKNAKDRDIVEIRSDGTFPHTNVNGNLGRRLTIRAGAGYTPTLRDLRNLGTDVFSLEGLTIDGRILAGEWKLGFHDMKGRLEGPGGIHHVANCTFLSGGVKQILRCLPDGKRPPSIVNCRFFYVHCVTPPGVTARMENCCLMSLASGEGVAEEGKRGMQLSRCTFWGLEPQNNWRKGWWLGGVQHSVSTFGQAEFEVTDCYFAAPTNLIENLAYQKVNHIAWRGQRNVFAQPFLSFYAQRAEPDRLADWQKSVAAEEGSFVDPSPLFEPRFWKLAPKSPGAGAGKDGRDLGADTMQVALPPPSSGLTRASAAETATTSSQPSQNVPPLPAAAEKPIVLLRAGKPVREFKQIPGAIAEAQAGDVIEVRGPGPFPIDLEPGFATPLHIRGAGGFRPELQLVTPQREIQAPLKFEHCDIVQRYGDTGHFAGAIEVTNCRWRSGILHLTGQPSRLTAKDSLFILTRGLAAYQEGTKLSLENCVVRTVSPVFPVNDATTTQIELKRCTFYNETPGGAPLLHGSEKARASVVSEYCAFHSRGQMDFLGLPNWRQSVKWQGKNNLYSGLLFNVFNEKNEVLRSATAEDWSKVWGEAEQNPTVVYQFEPLFVHTTLMSLAELRKVAEPVVQVASDRHQLPQLGCDWNLVGPGEAYEKALEASGQNPAERRPEVSSGGVISLLRGGKEVSAHRSLTEALVVAQDLDVLEIRTDALVPRAEQLAADARRRLTIRAGAGYAPTLAGLHSYSQDVWTLEGLTIGEIIAGHWIGERFGPTGGIHRLQNCAFTSEKLHQGFRCLADGKNPPAIVNCRFFSVHLASAKDTAVRIENSVLYRLVTGESKSRPGTGNVELVRNVFWGPEPHFAWRDRLGGSYASIQTNPESKLSVRDCYFVAPQSLLQIIDWHNSKPPFLWNGERNVYSTAYGYYVEGSGNTSNLKEFSSFVEKEQGSFDEPSVLFDPKFWKLTPGSPGSGVGPMGSDLGADTTRIALPSPTVP